MRRPKGNSATPGLTTRLVEVLARTGDADEAIAAGLKTICKSVGADWGRAFRFGVRDSVMPICVWERLPDTAQRGRRISDPDWIESIRASASAQFVRSDDHHQEHGATCALCIPLSVFGKVAGAALIDWPVQETPDPALLGMMTRAGAVLGPYVRLLRQDSPAGEQKLDSAVQEISRSARVAAGFGRVLDQSARTGRFGAAELEVIARLREASERTQELADRMLGDKSANSPCRA